MKKQIVIIGGGAAGMFAAIRASQSPDTEIIVVEQGKDLLSKVRISGGGRCNVTHQCFDPKELILNYPRGSKELLGPFHKFGPEQTIAWFRERGVKIKAEADGRMFPVTDSSETIIEALCEAAMGVRIWKEAKVAKIWKEDRFVIELKSGQQLQADCVMLATGSHPSGHRLAKGLGHTIVPAVPSLFTFNIPKWDLKELSGVSVSKGRVSLPELGRSEEGPILITHWGLSGPCVLKLSAWCARELKELGYETVVEVEWGEEVPKRLRKRVEDKSVFQMKGKTTFKKEFVTCGGVELKEVDFRRMESRVCPGLFFGGEILNIDGVTGGFNFQAAWTAGWIAGGAFSS